MGLQPRFTRHRLASGIELHCAEQGSNGGTPVLFLHGFTDSWFSWSRILPLLDESWHAIAPDQRGHGNSDRPEAYSIDDFALDGLQLLDALGYETAAVVGHCMGSFVARRMAAWAPHRITALTLVATAPDCSNRGMIEFERAVSQLSDPIDLGFIREFQESTIYRPVPAGFIDNVIAESRKLSAATWKAVMRNLLAVPRETGIECPTLVLGGDRDAVFSQDELTQAARLIPRATLEILPSVGHSPHWEVPAMFVPYLENHVRAHTAGLLIT